MLIRSLKLTAALFAATVALTASAQSVYGPESIVKVPFAFEAGSAHFAPGTYRLRQVGEHTLSLSDGLHTALLMANPEITSSLAASSSKVVFHRYGAQYFIEELYRPGMSTHLICVKGREQKLAAKTSTVQIASRDDQPAAAEIAILAQAN